MTVVHHPSRYVEVSAGLYHLYYIPEGSLRVVLRQNLNDIFITTTSNDPFIDPLRKSPDITDRRSFVSASAMKRWVMATTSGNSATVAWMCGHFSVTPIATPPEPPLRSSSNELVATVPESITIAEGSSSADFTITTAPGAGAATVTISALYGADVEEATLQVELPASTATPISGTITLQGRTQAFPATVAPDDVECIPTVARVPGSW